MTDTFEKLAIHIDNDLNLKVLTEAGSNTAITRLIQAYHRLHPESSADEAMDKALDALEYLSVYTDTDASALGNIAEALEAYLGDTKVHSLDSLVGTTHEQIDNMFNTIDGAPISVLYFRRAEGVCITLYETPDESRIYVTKRGAVTTQQKPESKITCSETGIDLLSALSNWKTADELGDETSLDINAVASWLETLCWYGLVWFSENRETRTLPGRDHGIKNNAWTLGLHPCCSVSPLFAQRNDKVIEGEPLPFMPRMGTLSEHDLQGFLFSFYRRGKVVEQIRICGTQIAETLRDTIPLLNGTLNRNELQANLAHIDSAALTNTIDHLIRFGIVSPITAHSEHMAGNSATATWMGHASVLLNYSGTRIWVDPLVFHQEHQPNPAQDIPPDRTIIGQVDAVLITHGDNDHLNPTALCHLQRTTPIIIPDISKTGPWQVDMKSILRTMGFLDIRELVPGDVMEFPGCTVTALTFLGEDWGLELSTLTYRVEQIDQSGYRHSRVFLGADSEGMSRLGHQISGGQPIDLAFLGVSGNTEAHVMTPGFGYGEFYQNWIPRERHSRFTNLTDGPEAAVKLANAIQAKKVFGYAAGGGSYIPTAYSDEGDNETLARLLTESELGSKPLQLLPGVAIPISA